MSKQYMTAAEVAEMVGVSSSKAYRIIKELNEQLAAKGYLTIRGKISRAYFCEKWYGLERMVQGEHI